MTTTPCDLIADNARRVMDELDTMVSRVSRVQNTVNGVLDGAANYISGAADLLPDPSTLTPVSEINNMLANIDASCPQLNVEDITGFASDMQESYQSLLRSSKRDPLQSLRSLQDNLRRQFNVQGTTSKLADLESWLECIEALCGTLDGFAPGKGNTPAEITNYYTNGLAINNEGDTQILPESVQDEVTEFESRESGMNDYIDSLSLLGVIV